MTKKELLEEFWKLKVKHKHSGIIIIDESKETQFRLDIISPTKVFREIYKWVLNEHIWYREWKRKSRWNLNVLSKKEIESLYHMYLKKIEEEK